MSIPRPLRSARLACLAFAALGTTASAEVNPDDLSRKLVDAFLQGAGIRTTKPAVSDKSVVGVRVRTVRFAVANHVYRIVFSEDGMVSVTFLSEGDLASQPIWTRPAKEVSAEEIVNLIYGRETGRSFDFATGKGDETTADTEREWLRRKAEPRGSDGSELRWNELMNQVLRGETASISGSSGGGDGGFSRAAAMGRAADPCGGGPGGVSPQKAAALNVAQAIAASIAAARMQGAGGTEAKGKDEAGLTDRSRDYEKKGRYGVLEELEKSKERVASQEMVRLIQDTGTDTADLFRKSLAESDATSKDPHSRAAGRNFRSLIDRSGEKTTASFVRRALKKIVVDVAEFNDRRALAPGAPVIYDRLLDLYFVDPTFSSPSEARFLLSVATWYEAETDRFKLNEAVEGHRKLQNRISEMEHATLGRGDERALAKEKTRAAESGKALFEFALHVTRNPVRIP